MGRKHQQSKKLATKKQAAGAETEVADTANSKVVLGATSATPTATDALPFDCAALAGRALLGLPRALTYVVEALRLGICDYLDSMSCARVARVARVPKTIVEVCVAESIARSLKATSIEQDVVEIRQRPLLALSHLESLAQSDLLFRVCRELLKLCSHTESPPQDAKGREAVLLEFEGDEDELFKTVAGLLSTGNNDSGSDAVGTDLSEAMGELSAAASSNKGVGAAAWYSEFRQALHSWVVCGNPREEVLPVDPNGVLTTFLLGVEQLLPQTKVAAEVADGIEDKSMASRFLAQAFDRLLFPMSTWDLVCKKVIGRNLASKHLPPSSQIWAFGSNDRYYVLLLE